MARFIKGALFGAAVGYGVWRFQYPGTPDGGIWVVGGAIAFGILHAWFGHRLLQALIDWLSYRM